MNWAHVHLLLNHIPLIGMLFGTALLLLAASKKNEERLRIALGVFVVAALVALPTYLTGEPAEGVVEHTPGIAEASIEQHEEAALPALIALEALGLASLIGLFIIRRSRGYSASVATACLALAFVASGLLAWTANLGGQIHHTEIRGAPAAVEISEDAEED